MTHLVPSPRIRFLSSMVKHVSGQVDVLCKCFVTEMARMIGFLIMKKQESIHITLPDVFLAKDARRSKIVSLKSSLHTIIRALVEWHVLILCFDPRHTILFTPSHYTAAGDL